MFSVLRGTLDAIDDTDERMNVCCLATIMIFSDAVWRQPALQLDRELRAPGVCVEHIDMPARYFNRTVAWGAPGYFDRIRHRIPAVRLRLQTLLTDRPQPCRPQNSQTPQQPATGWLALFDADIVALRNVSARFTHAFASAPQTHLLVQQEWPCNSAPHALCVNGGMWVARRSARALALLERAEWLLGQLRIPDQDALQIMASEARGEVLFLDRARYANGYTALRTASSWSAHDAHLVHVNWLATIECKLLWLAHFRATRFHLLSSHGAMHTYCGVSL